MKKKLFASEKKKFSIIKILLSFCHAMGISKLKETFFFFDNLNTKPVTANGLVDKTVYVFSLIFNVPASITSTVIMADPVK